MAHYFIKCVRCSQICWNETVLFDTEDTVMDLADVLAGSRAEPADSNAVSDEFPDSSAEDLAWGDAPVSFGNQAAGTDAGGTAEQLRRYMKCRQIQDYCSRNHLTAPELEFTEVRVTNDYISRQGMERTGKQLLTGVRFQKKPGGPKMLAKKRFCPTCLCELPSQSGTMPTYTVTLMGSSAAGKTVYLAALQQVIDRSVEILPYKSTLQCTTASRSYDELSIISRRLFDEGMLPATTQREDAEPLVLKLSYKVAVKLPNQKDMVRTKECLLAINDMRGEDFTAAGGDNLIKRAQYFAHANAFMFLVSPFNMRYFNANLGLGETDAATNLNVHNTLITNMDEYILGNFKDRVIKCPSVIMLGKADELKNNWERLRIPPDNAVVAAEIEPKYTGSYFRTHNESTRYLMTCDQTLCEFLSRAFRQENQFFTSVSSLGPDAKIETQNGQKRVANPSLARPVRVLDPLLFILMKLGFLPEFYKMEKGKDFSKSNDLLLENWMAMHTLENEE